LTHERQGATPLAIGMNMKNKTDGKELCGFTKHVQQPDGSETWLYSQATGVSLSSSFRLN
jgi:hypothetical protein